jgi:phosphoribosylformimino-5-aminoimidazole carboxamide ribotide isomerase
VEIIPVIDLMGGIVVHARRGDRQNYQPISSPLCSGSLAGDIVAGYLNIHPFSTIYIADLDAITGKGDSGPVIMQLRRQFPALRFWVDNGISSAAACRAWLQQGHGDLVLGSEAQSDLTTLDDLAAERSGDRIVLSLDFKDGKFLGPEALQNQPSLWPQRIIAMTLSRVGSDSGPDFDLLKQLQTKAPAKKLFAAGGVRGGEDLVQLSRRGISGVLVASALHAGRIGKREIAAVCT